MKISIEGTVYEYDADRMMLAEAKQLQAVTGMTLQRWQHALSEMDATAVQGLVWLLRRRAGESELRFEEVDFDLGTFEVVDDNPDPSQATDAEGAA